MCVAIEILLFQLQRRREVLTALMFPARMMTSVST